MTLLLAFGFLAQGHDLKVPEAMSQIAFLQGSWSGEQNFVTRGPALVGKATDAVAPAIGGKYFEEKLSTTLPGRDPSDTRHFITYDPKASKFKAWWFNDASVGAMELEGEVRGGALVLETPPGKSKTIFRATYKGGSDELTFVLELKSASGWQKLFVTNYKKSN